MEEMAQLVKCFAEKLGPELRSLEPTYSLGMMAYSCNPSTCGERGTGKGESLKLVGIGERFIERPCLQQYGG